MKNITNSDYNHAKKICRDFKTKNLGEYHHLHLKVTHYYQLMFPKTLEKCA